jgi:hypothetical protein
MKNLADAMAVLVNIESEALLDENFDLKKELKKTMKEYRNITKGMTKEEQSVNRASNKEMQNLYFRKRILQNYEEYNKHGSVKMVSQIHRRESYVVAGSLYCNNFFHGFNFRFNLLSKFF